MALLASPAHTMAADLAVVIDDVGYNKARGLRAVDLPGHVTLAVLPFAPHTRELLAAANARARDVIIHQPMQPMASPHARHEQDTLTLQMSSAEFDHAVTRAIKAIPTRVGLSNHTGSALTADYPRMLQLMQHLKDHQLFFLDSRTTAATKAEQAAADAGVLALRRDVFLDNERTPAAIHKAFTLGIAKARKQGTAILIGHPYRVTLDYLEHRLSDLPADVRLIGLGEMAEKVKARRAMLARLQRPADLHISLGQ